MGARNQSVLTALRAMVDVERYSFSDLGGDRSDAEPPSLTSPSASEDDDPEDCENLTGKEKKKKKKRKTKRHERRRFKEAKAIATAKTVVNLPEFTRKNLSELAENFGQFLRMTGQTHASGRRKLKQASTVECFDRFVLLMPLLAPAAACGSSGFPNQ